MRVLIIGAGLGGLTLLHGLRAAGIDARVFERTPRAGAQPASYGIHLNADGLAALHACLPEESWQLIDQAGVPAPLLIHFRDTTLRPLSTIDQRFPEHATDPVTRRRAISRGRLRHALLQGTGHDVDGEPLVHLGTRFVRYETTSDGVRAFFDDGSHADGDLLVGADGSGSRVRQQLLPSLQREDLDIVNIAGRVPLTGAVAAALPADLVDGSINNVVPARPGWMFLSTWDTGDPDTTDVSGGAGQYVVWAWAGAASSYPDGFDQLDGTALQRLVHDRISTWAPALRVMVDQTDPATVTRVPLRTMPTLPAWEPSRVTLLGDAIHNMTPMAGIGANTALRDADQLRRALVDHPRPVVRAVGAYETTMRTYANQALALSTRNARNAALGGRASRTAFRTLLRVGTVVPPLKHRMFGATLAPVLAY
jgi:2-polyprenyl-6-methoxyphenol hydroxylase-like FAD-dependent oxidoreductase